MTTPKYTDADLEAVSDNPEWTKDDLERSMSFDEAFPDLAKRVRGPQKAPTKTMVTLRLDRRVVDHFRAGGDGWQTRINDALMKAAGLSGRS